MIARIAAIAFVLVLLFSGVFVARWGWADFLARHAYEEMGKWDDKPVTQEGWEYARGYLEQAVALAPSNPVYQQRISRLYRIRFRQLDDSEIEQDGETALTHLRRSVSFRPYWGDGWAELAYLKRLLNQRDEEYFHALDRAIQTGAWEPGVIRLVNLVGIVDFAILDSNWQDRIMGSIVRGLRSPVDQISRRTRDQLAYSPQVKQKVVAAMHPYLVEAEWPRSVQFNFFQLLEWLWPVMTPEEQQRFLPNAVAALNRTSTPAVWVSRVRDDDFRQTICASVARDDGLREKVSGRCG